MQNEICSRFSLSEARLEQTSIRRATPTATCLDRQHLPAFVVAAGRTGGVRRRRAAALRALVQLRAMPAVGRFARAQAHL